MNPEQRDTSLETLDDPVSSRDYAAFDAANTAHRGRFAAAYRNHSKLVLVAVILALLTGAYGSWALISESRHNPDKGQATSGNDNGQKTLVVTPGSSQVLTFNAQVKAQNGITDLGALRVTGGTVLNGLTVNGDTTLNGGLVTAQNGNFGGTLTAANVRAGNITGNFTGSYTGNGSALGDVNAAELNSLPASYYLNSSNQDAGTLSDARLSGDVTLQGNVFNGAGQLVQLLSDGSLPGVNGSNLTNVNAASLNGHDTTFFTNAGNLSTGTLADGRLSTNVALLNASNVFTNTNTFQNVTVQGTIDGQSAVLAGNVSALSFTQNGNAVCDTSGNCVTANGITGSGTTDTLALFTASGAIGDSLVSQSGTTVTVAGSLAATALQGDGSAVTNVNAAKLNSQPASFYQNASNLTAGTISDARLSSNVALLGANNVFTGTTNSFNDLSVGGTVTLADGSTLTDDPITGMTFTVGGSSFTFPSGGGASQQICTTGISCASGGGVAVLLGQSSAQVNNQNETSIFTNNTGGGNLLQQQVNGSDVFVVSNAGNVTATGFNGNGSNLSSVNAAELQGFAASYFTDASNLSSGTVADARLSSNVALLNASNTFSGATNTFSGVAATSITQNGNNVCDTSGNCSGVGGGVTTPGGTTGTLALFSGAQSIGDSIVTQAGSTVTVAGTLAATALQGDGSAISNLNASNITSGTLSVARGGTGAGSFTANGIVFGNGTGALGVTAAGTTGECLVGNSGAAPSFEACTTASGGASPGGSAGGDLSGTYPNPTVSGLSGTALSIASLASGNFLVYNGSNWVNVGISGDLAITGTGVATIQNGSVTNAKLANSSLTVTAGNGLSGGGSVALGSSTTLSVAYGSTANTAVQGNVTLTCAAGTGNLSGGGGVITLGTGGSCGSINTVASPSFTSITLTTALTVGNGGTGATTAAGARTNLGAAASGANSDITSITGLTTALSAGQGGTGVNGATAGNGKLLIGNGSGYTLANLVQGSGISITNGAGSITIAVDNTVCTTAGNCSGVGGGVTTTSGTSGTIALFNGSQTIADSIITQSGTTITVAGTLAATALQGDGSAITNLNASNLATGTVASALLTGSYSGITGVGALASGSIASGFGAIATTNNISTSAALQGNTLNIGSGSFAVNATGAITAASGITSSGTIIFSSLNTAGVVHTSATGQLSTSKVVLGTDTSGDYVADLGTLTGLTTSGGTGAGSVPTLSVTYGAAVNTAAQGNTALSFTGSGNLTGGVTATAGGGVSANTLAVVNNPTFSGLITGQAGLTVTGTVTLSSLGAGLVQTDASGVISTGAVDRNSSTFFTNNLSVANGGTGANAAAGARTNLGAAASGANSDITSITGLTTDLAVSQGGTGAATAAGARTNLSAAASGANSDITSLTALSSINNTGALSIGNTGQALTLQGNASSVFTATSGAFSTSVGFQTPTSNVVYQFDTAAAGTYGICTTAGNCAGAGGGVTTPGGTSGTIAVFTGSGSIGDSLLSESGTTVTVGGTLAVNTIAPTAALLLGVTGQNLTMQGATVAITSTSGANTNTLSFATPSGSSHTITVPNASGTVAVSASGPLSIDAAGNITCPSCVTSGGGGGGASAVDSLDTITGAITLQGTANQIVVTDNSGTKTITLSTPQDINTSSSPTFSSETLTGGLSVTGAATAASFNGLGLTANATGFSVAGGTAVRTLTVTANATIDQNLSSTSSPTFGGLTLSSALTVANGGTGANAAAGARTNLGAAASGANSDITSITGLTTALSAGQGGTGVNGAAAANGKLLIGNGSGYTLANLTQGSGISITNGAGAITIAIDSTVCTTAGNCAGAGGGVTTTGGTSGTIALFNGTQTIADSIITQSGTTVTVAGTLAATALQGDGSLITNLNASNLASGTVATGRLSGSYTGITGVGALAAGSIATGFGTISTGNAISTTAALQGNTLSIGSGTFAVNATGAVTAASGITSSGTILFSSLNTAGVVHTSATGQLSTSAVALGTDTSGNYVASLGTLTGLTASTSSGVGISPTLSVTYGAAVNTAAQGNTALSFTGSGNLTGGVTATAGGGVSANTLAVVNNPTFSGLITGQAGLTVTGAAVNLNVNSNFDTNIDTGTSTGNVAIGNTTGTFSVTSHALTISSTGAIAGVTTLSASGAITAASTGNTINGLIISSGALSGITGYAQASGNFAISGSGSFATGTGAVSLNGATTVSSSLSVQGSSGLSVGVIGSTAGQLLLASPTAGGSISILTNSAQANAVTVSFPTIAANDTFCLVTLNNCSSGGGSISGGTTNYIARFTSATTLGTGLIYDDGTYVGINNSTTNNGLLSLQGASATQTTFFAQGVSNASVPTAIIRSGATQTNNLLQLQNSSGTVMDGFTASGTLYVGISAPFTIPVSSVLSVSTAGATNVGETIRGVASQSAHLLDLQNSAGTVLASVDASGNFTAVNGNFTGSLTAATGLTVTAGGATITGNSTVAGTLGVTASSGVAATIQGAAGQDIADFNKSTGTTAASIDQFGNLHLATGGVFSASTSSVNAPASTFSVTNSNTSATQATTDDIRINQTGTVNGSSTNVLNGIHFSNVTPAGGNTFNGIEAGTGYNAILDYNNGTTLISGTGILQNAALSNSIVYSNITGVGALTAGSIASGFGTISTANNITTTTQIQGGTFANTGSSFAVNSSGNVTAALSGTTGATLVCQNASSQLSTCTNTYETTTTTDFIKNGTAQQTANFNILSSAIGNVAATIQGAGSGTADILDINIGSGALEAKISSSGIFSEFGGINAGSAITGTLGKLNVLPGATSTVGEIIQGNNGQTADLLDLETNNGSVVTVAKIDANGNLTAVNGSFTGTLSTATGLTVTAGGASITGNSSITGTLGVSALLTASNGLTVTTGATSLGGTLGVTGLATFSGGATLAANQNLTLTTGTGTIAQGFTAATGSAETKTVTNSSASGASTVNGQTLSLVGTTTSGTNTNNAINFTNVAGGATNNTYNGLNFGTGYTNLIQSANFTVDGSGNVSGVAGTFTGAITSGTSSVAGSLVLQQGNGNTITLHGTTESNNVSLNLPAGVGTSDTLCLVSLNNCSSGGGSITGGTTNLVPHYTSATALAPGLLFDNGTAGGYNITSQLNSSSFGIQAAASSIGLTVQGASGQDIADFNQNSGASGFRVDQFGDVIANGTGNFSDNNSTSGSGLFSTIHNTNTSATAATLNGIAVSLSGAANASGGTPNTTNGISLANVVVNTGNVINGINFGTGYSSLLTLGATQLISGAGLLQNATIDSSLTYTNLQKVGALNTGSIASGFGTILTTNSIQGSSLTATGAVSGNTLSSTAGTTVGNTLTVSAGGAAITGNSTVTGTLGVSALLTASNGLTVTAGATSLGGTLGVTGLATLSGGATLAANQNLTLTTGTGSITQGFTAATGSAETKTVTNSSASGASTVNGQTISLVGTTTSGTNINNALNFTNVAAGATNNTYNGLNFGTGYTNLIQSATYSVDGSGNTTGVSGTFSGTLTAGAGYAGGKLAVQPGAPSTIGETIRAAASQTADLLQLQDSTGAVLASFNATGALNVPLSGTTGATLVCHNASGQLSTCTNSYETTTTTDFIKNGTGVQTSANFNIQSAAAGSVAATIYGASSQTADLLDLGVAGQSTPLVTINNLGKITFSTGSAASDLNLYRWGAAGGTAILKTDENFWAASKVQIGAVSFTNTAALQVNTFAVGDIGVAIQGVSGQTGDLLDISTNAALADKVNASGQVFLGGGTAVTSNAVDLNVGQVSVTAGAGGNGGGSGSGNARLFVLQVAATNGETIKLNGAAPTIAPAFQIRTTGNVVLLNEATNSANLSLNGTGSVDQFELQDVNGNVLSKFDVNGNDTSYGTNTTLANLAVPVISLTAGTSGVADFYVVTATNAQGESVISNSIGTTNTTVTISWTQVPGATGYKVYRNTSNAFTSGSLLLATITNGSTVSYSDAAGSPGVGLPPTAPTGTGLSVQGWAGQTAASEVLQAGTNQTGDLLDLKDSSGNVLTSFDSSGNLHIARAATGTTNVLTARVSGDSNDRFTIDANGQIRWGSGSAATDVGLSRSGVGILSTGGSLRVGGSTVGTLGVLQSAASSLGFVAQGATSATQPVAVIEGGATPGAGADLLQLQNSSATVLAKFDANGNLSGVAATFTGAITSGTASVAGSLVLNQGNTHTITINGTAESNNVSLNLPAGVSTSDTFCLVTLNNCSSGGGSITGGTTNLVPHYTSATALAPGLLFDNGTAGGYNIASQLNTSSFGIQAAAASIGLTVEGSGSDITDFENSGGTVVAKINSLGGLVAQSGNFTSSNSSASDSDVILNDTDTNSTATTTVHNGTTINLSGTNNATVGANTLNAVNLSTVVTKTNNVFNGLNFGSNYTNGLFFSDTSTGSILNVAGTSIISGSGLLQNAAIDSTLTYTNLQKVGALNAGSIASGFGTILTTNSIQGSSLTATGAVSGNTLSSTAGTTVGNTLTVSAGGAAITGNSTVTGTLGVSALLTASNGLTVTTGGLTVSAGGATITGNSTVTGTLGVSALLTASNGLTVTTGGLTVSAGGASITGNSTVTGTLGVSALLTASNGLTVTTGATSLGGTLGVTGLATLSGGATLAANQNLTLTTGTGSIVQGFSAATGSAQTDTVTNTSASGASTVNGKTISLVGTTTSGTNTNNALNFTNVAGGATNNTYNGLNFGTGYTNLIQSANFSINAAGNLTTTGSLNATEATAGTVTATLQAASTGTADILDLKNGAGGVGAKFDSTGFLTAFSGINAGAAISGTGGKLDVVPNGIGTVGEVIQGNNGQTGDLLDIQTNNGSVVTVAKFDASGNLSAVAGTFTGAITSGTSAVAGSLVLNQGNTHTITINGTAESNNVSLNLPAGVSTSDTFCLVTLNNCSSGGGSITGGTTNLVPHYTSATTLGTGLLFDNGTFTGINDSTTNNGLLSILGLTATQSGLFVQGTASSSVATTVIKAGTSQTGDLLDIQPAGSTTPIAKIDVSGNLTAVNGVFTGTLSTATGLTVSAGGASITGNSTITGTLGVSALLTASNGLTVTAGGLTISAGGATITGNSTVTGTLGVSALLTASNGLTVTTGGETITAGGLTVSAGGAAITGNSSVTGTLGVSGLLSANGGATLAANQNLTLTTGTGTIAQGFTAATGSAETKTVTNSSASGASTVNGQTLSLVGTTTSGTNTNNAINFTNVAGGATNNTYNGLNFGTGYTSLLTLGATPLISGAGLLQNAAIDSALTYTNLQKVGALNTGSIASGFGTILTTNSIQGSTLTSTAGTTVGNTLTVSAGGAAITGNSTVTGTLGVTASSGVAAVIQGASGQDITDFKNNLAATKAAIDQFGNFIGAGQVITDSESGNAATNKFNLTNTNVSVSTITTDDLRVGLTGTDNSSGVNVLNGINFTNVTAHTNNTYNGLEFGTGYTSILAVGSTPLINGSGLLQNAAIDSTLTYTNLQKVGALTAGSIASGFGTILTTNSIQGSTLTSTAGTTVGNTLTVSAGGAAITGNSTVTGTLGVSALLTASNALTVTAGATSLGGTLGVTGLATLSGGATLAANQNLTLTTGTGSIIQGFTAATGSAETKTVTNNSASGASTVNGQTLSLVGTTTSGTNTNNAINFTNVTAGATNNTYNGLNFGTGYTNLIQSANFSVTAAGNLTGVAGTFSGAVTSGTASAAGSLVLQDSTNHPVTLSSAVQANTVALSIPADTHSTDTVCLLTLANCVGTGGGISGSGTTNTIALFTGSGAIGNSILTQSGTALTAAGTLAVTNVGGITLGVAGSTAGNLTFANTTSSRVDILQSLSPSGVGNATIQIPAVPGGSTDTVCLQTAANCVGTGGSVSVSGGTTNFVPRFTSGTAITAGSIFDAGSGISLGSSTVTGLLNVGTSAQFQVSSAGAVVAVGVNSGTGSIQGSGGLSISGGGASITGNSTVTGTLGVSALLTASNGLTVTTGGETITAGGLTVSAGGATITGNSTVTGTLGVSALLTASNALTVTAGATSLGGTLGVTGLATLSGGATLAANQNLTLTTGTGTITQGFSAATGSAETKTVTNNSASGASTVNGQTVSLVGTTTSGTNTNNAINFTNVTAGATNNTYNGLNFGTGYSSLLTLGATPLISGAGLLQNAAIDSTLTYSNLQKVGALTVGSIASGFGTILTTNSIQGSSVTATGSITTGTTAAAGSLILQDGSNHPVTLSTATQANTVSLSIPADTHSSDTVCLLTLANCFGAGGGISGSGTTNFVAKFNGSGTITNSQLFDNGSFVGINNSTTNNGQLSVLSASATQTGLFVQSAASASVVTAVLQEGTSQTGDILDLNSSATTLSSFDSAGNLHVNPNGGSSTSGGVTITNTTNATSCSATMTWRAACLIGSATSATGSALFLGGGAGGSNVLTIQQQGSNVGALISGTNALTIQNNVGGTGGGPGAISILGGIGFSGTTATNGGTGNGAIVITASAGQATTGTTGVTGGTGAASSVTAGAGGAATGASGANIGGTGGAVTLTGGAGGAVTSATGTAGSGGSLTLQGGAAGTGGAVAGSIGNITLQASGGKVGIGNASPTQALDVTGIINASTSVTSPLFDIAAAGTLRIGTTNATTITIGSGAMTTGVAGAFAVSGSATFNGNTSVSNTKTFTVNGGATSLTGATSGDALTVSNSTSTGNILVLKDNATTVLTVADGGNVTSSGTLTVTNSGGATLGVVGTTAGKLTLASATAGGSIAIQTDALEASAVTVSFPAITASDTICLQTAANCSGGAGSVSGGTAGYVARFTGSTTLGIGQLADNGTVVNVGATTPGTGSVFNVGTTNQFQVNTSGNVTTSGTLAVNNTTTLTSNSTTAFLVQTTGSVALLTADASGMQVVIGNSTNGISLSGANGLVASGTAQHNKTISLPAEYAGAVLDAASDATCSSANAGTMTTGLATAVTGFGNTNMNYYNWLATLGSAQCYDVVVEVPIPTDFASWQTTAISVSDYSSNTTNGTVTMQVHDSTSPAGTYDVAFSGGNLTPSSNSTWQNNTIGGAALTGGYTAGGYMTLQIRLSSVSSANVRLGTINLNYKSKF